MSVLSSTWCCVTTASVDAVNDGAVSSYCSHWQAFIFMANVQGSCVECCKVTLPNPSTMDYKTHLQQLYFADNITPRVLDARPYTSYLQQRLEGAVNIDLLHLTSRCFLLPDKHVPFAVVVPSQYTVVADASLHGRQLPDMSVAIYLKATQSLPEFLITRGWTVTAFLLDEPALWAAASDLGLLEQQVQDPVVLSRRCLFASSQLLSSSVASIEASLAAKYACKGYSIQQQQQQQHGHDHHHHQQQQQHVPSSEASSSSKSTQLIFHALDIGCGSGRDMAWLASRQEPVPVSCPAHPASQQLQMQPWECCEAAPAQEYAASWHVTGLDGWLGALERAADLAEALQLSPQQLRLVYGTVNRATGDLQLLRLPETNRLISANHVVVVHAGMPHHWPKAAAAALQGDLLLPRTALFGNDAGASDGLHAAVLQGGSCCSAKFDLVLCVRFLERSLLPRLRHFLNPGGFILYSTFIDGPGLRAFGRPSGPEHVLQPGELASLYFGPGQGFEVLQDEVVVSADGREMCQFIAKCVIDAVCYYGDDTLASRPTSCMLSGLCWGSSTF